ncbi:N-acetyltransferase family protein [Halolamina sp. CBA1230]|uniref:arsinothricin resistance N-acetyltransferase ArsN1 family B n=1 Tax=Halolamina sp. CBA1230 TaxID=1853690 RepID=UPI0009A23F8A|nr:arsinothricin resistance N-acetyltransferase ArsN1 family B [Halolamina sp. CBA1230]QKY21395.1 N-acetyltransferase family protein [Halolamina sp. CBA1230]
MAVTVRAAAPADATAIRDIYAPLVEETHVSFETEPPSVESMRSRLRETLERFPWLVCEYEDEVVGYAYAGPHNDRPAYQWGVNVSVYVDAQRRRNGVARGLYESLFALLRRQGYYRAYAVIALPNPASVELHESMGFERVGVYEAAGYKHGEWHDVGHWESALQPPDPAPDPPTPFDQLGETDDVADALRRGEASIRL